MSETIYCVYITTYSGMKMPPMYIGSSSVEKVKNGYFGSVSSKKWKQIWKNELQENPEYFNSLILTYYKTREEALSFELELQKELDVVKNVNFINESFAQVNGYYGRDTSGENNPMFGLNKENSELVRNTAVKISKARKKFCIENPEKHPSLGKSGWNAGLSKEENNSINQQAKNIKEFYNSEEGQKSLELGRKTRELKDKADPSRIERRKERYKEIAKKRIKLNDDEREYVICCYLQGYTRQEIAKILNHKVSYNYICKIIKNYVKMENLNDNSTNAS